MRGLEREAMDSHTRSERPFFAGDWRVEPAAGAISRGEVTRHLEPRVMQVLVALAEKPGEVVSRSRLLSLVWSDLIVNDEALSRCIAELRKAFGDQRQGPRTIETVPKKGYRFLLPTHPCVRAVAVLPFANMTGDDGYGYLASGLAELLTTELARVCRLRVISSTSASRFARGQTALRDYAEEMAVDVVVEGALVRHGETFEVTVQLIDAIEDRHLWAQTYGQSLEDAAAVQVEVAHEIANELQTRRTPVAERRVSRVAPSAFEAYLKGRHFWSRRDPGSLRSAMSLFRSAVDIDPGYAPAHAGLADTHILLALYGIEPPVGARRSARDALSIALTLESGSPEARVSECARLLFFEWEFLDAERQLRSVVSAHCSLPLAFLGLADALAITGRPQEALSAIREAVALDPYDPGMSMNLAGFQYLAGERAPALDQYRLTLDANPGFLPALYRLGVALALEGHVDDALNVLSKLPADDAAIDVVTGKVVIASLAGAEEPARRSIAELDRRASSEYVSPVRIAVGWAALADYDRALTYVLRALETRDPLLTLLNSDPLLIPLQTCSDLAQTLRAHGMEEFVHVGSTAVGSTR